MTTECKCNAIFRTKVKGWKSKWVKCKCPFCGEVERVWFRGDGDD